MPAAKQTEKTEATKGPAHPDLVRITSTREYAIDIDIPLKVGEDGALLGYEDEPILVNGKPIEVDAVTYEREGEEFKNFRFLIGSKVDVDKESGEPLEHEVDPLTLQITKGPAPFTRELPYALWKAAMALKAVRGMIAENHLSHQSGDDIPGLGIGI